MQRARIGSSTHRADWWKLGLTGRRVSAGQGTGGSRRLRHTCREGTVDLGSRQESTG